MSLPDTVADTSSRPSDPTHTPGRSYSPGFSDGLGERLLVFDKAAQGSLEFLQVKKEFSAAPSFEAALQQRVDQLHAVRHPSLARVREVQRMGLDERLALVSHHTAGRRLSELVQEARGPVFAAELIRQLAPALATLHQQGGGVAHGLLTADRVIVRPDGRLVIAEYVFGAAIESLHLPAHRLRTELGIAVPSSDEPITFDGRGDVIQLGLLALSLLAGRRIDPAKYPANIATIVEQAVQTEPGTPSVSSGLRQWIERALQLGDHPFLSPYAANDYVTELLGGPEPSVAVAVPETPAPPAAVPKPESKAASVTPAPASPALTATPVATPAASPRPAVADRVLMPASEPAPAFLRFGGASPLTLGLAAIALVEAVVIAGLLYTRPSTSTAVVDPAPAAVAGVALAPSAAPSEDASVNDAGSVEPPVATAAVAPAATRPAADADRPAPPRPVAGGFGAVRIAAPLELHVFIGDRLVGTTVGPIALDEGRHTLDLVNEATGYRGRETVDVRAGQMTTASVSIPNGRVSINAVPWAVVSIDGTTIGETPIANLPVPIGQHEFVFRHPQFGEHRQTVVVRADDLTRVSATLQR